MQITFIDLAVILM